MKRYRKGLQIVGAALGVVLGALIILPIVFRGRIVERVKAGLNDAVAARVDWEGTGLTFFRNFPNLTLRLERLSVEGVDVFAGDTLAAMDELRVVVDAGTVLRSVLSGGQLVIRSIDVERPVLHLRVRADGAANWNIARPSATNAAPDTKSKFFEVGLRRLTIRAGSVTFDNEQSDVHAALAGLNHSLSGDFTRDRSTVRTRTDASAVTVRFAGLTYLSSVAASVVADIDADMTSGTFTFGNNEVRLNDLQLGFSGSVARSGEDLQVNMRFTAPRGDAKQILSLVPAIYAHDFASLQATGAFTLDGEVRGTYTDSTLPMFAVHARVDSASFRYPDLPLPARNVFLDLSIENPGGSADNTVIDVRRFHIELGADPVEATLVVRTPVTDPDLDLRLDGRIDLANVGRTLKLDGIEELSGIVTADARVNTRMSALESQQYDRVAASGSASITGMTVRTADLPHAVAIDELRMQLTPQRAELSTLRGRIGKSDLSLTGSVDNLLGFVLRSEDLRGSAQLRSDFVDLDEWRSSDRDRSIIPVPARLDFALDAQIAQLSFGKLRMSNARGTVRVKDQHVTLEDFGVSTLGGRIGMSGFYETSDVAKPTFDLRLGIDSVDIPAAFGALVTVQRLAPVAQFAAGTFDANLRIAGALGADMLPLFEVLSGQGTFLTSRLQLHDFPAMNLIADRLKLQHLKNPALQAIRSSFAVQDGRLHVSPFDVAIGESRMSVSGSNGIDQSLQYAITFAVPRSMLGTEANNVVNGLITQAGRTGLVLQPADVIQIGVDLTGTIRDPSVSLRFGGVGSSVRDAVTQAVDQRIDAVTERVDSARLEAVRRAQAEADRIVREAEERAVTVRAEAKKLADEVRAEGHRQADELLARATNPLARAAAQAAADRLRKTADDKALQIETGAEQRADDLVEEARKRGEVLVAAAGGDG